MAHEFFQHNLQRLFALDAFEQLIEDNGVFADFTAGIHGIVAGDGCKEKGNGEDGGIDAADNAAGDSRCRDGCRMGAGHASIPS